MTYNGLQKGELLKVAVIGSLLAIALFATYYFHFILKIDIIFTHFLYVPIILASLWWGRKGVAVAVFLALQLLVMHILSPIWEPVWVAVARAFMFVVIGVVVATLCEKKQMLEDKLRAYSGTLEQRVDERTSELKRSEEKRRAILNGISDAVIVLDRDLNIIWANEVAVNQYGAVRGRKCYEAYKWLKEPCSDCIARKTCENGMVRSSEEEGILKDGNRITFITSCSSVRDMDGKVVSVVEVHHDITERKAAEERIEHLNSVLKAIRDVNQLIVTEKDRDSLLKNTCDVLIEARGYEAAWLGSLSDGETFDRVVGSGFREDVDRFCERVMDGNHPPCIKKALAGKETVVVMDKSGECGDCPFKNICAGRETAVIRIERGCKLFGLLAISLAADVTLDDEEEGLLKEVASDIALALHNMDVEEARKTAEDRIKASLKEKEVLLREIHHRVKNNLHVVSSLLDMQARGARNEDTIDALTESKDRLNAMALIHAQLYESSDLSEINMNGFVDKLLMQLLRSYQVQGTKITPILSVVDYPFPISMAVPVGLIVNELLSNALKYAFVGRKEGTIKVSLTASEEGRINLTVSDGGVGLPAGFDIDKTGTLGLRLVKILTEDQLRGNLEVISKEGVTFNIEFNIRTNSGV